VSGGASQLPSALIHYSKLRSPLHPPSGWRLSFNRYGLVPPFTNLHLLDQLSRALTSLHKLGRLGQARLLAQPCRLTACRSTDSATIPGSRLLTREGTPVIGELLHVPGWLLAGVFIDASDFALSAEIRTIRPIRVLCLWL